MMKQFATAIAEYLRNTNLPAMADIVVKLGEDYEAHERMEMGQDESRRSLVRDLDAIRGILIHAGIEMPDVVDGVAELCKLAQEAGLLRDAVLDREQAAHKVLSDAGVDPFVGLAGHVAERVQVLVAKRDTALRRVAELEMELALVNDTHPVQPKKSKVYT